LLHLAWIVPLFLLIAYLSSPRFRGDVAESRVRRILAAGLERNLYTVWNDLLLPSGGGTTHIDHLIVCKFGIFVIESQYASGWLSGTEVQREWQQRHAGYATRLENPLHANRLQVEAVQRLLDYPASVFHPLVVLVGHKGFRKQAPIGVVSPEKLLDAVRKKSRQLLTPEQANLALRRIDECRLGKRGRQRADRWSVLRWLLIAVLLVGAWAAYREPLSRLFARLETAQEQREAPEAFHPDGRRKSDREIWEDSLVCAWSPDTGRCTCLEPGGATADVDTATCRALAERGSILQQ